VAGTPVLLSDGTTKPIEKIEVGDEVYARPHDNPTGELIKGKVVRTFVNRKDVWSLAMGNPASGKTLTVRGTAEHPFYVQNQGWTPLGELREGDQLTSSTGETMNVLSKEHHSEPVEVYNFEVEDAHTYYVGESQEQSVLVHNACPDCGSWDRYHIFTMCGAKPAGKGALYDAVKNHGAISGQLHGELTQETMGQTVSRLPHAADAAKMTEAAAQMVPGLGGAMVVTSETTQVYGNSRDSGNSHAYSLYVSIGTMLGRFTGVENFSYAFDGTDPVSGEQYSGGWRAAYTVLGFGEMVLTALGIEQAGKAAFFPARPVVPQAAKAGETIAQEVKSVTEKTVYTVEPAMQAKDIAEKVLVDGKYLNNPTAKNMNDLIRQGYNYVGSKQMNGRYMYVIDQEGNIIIGTRAKDIATGRTLHMPHPTLIGGENPVVQGAGIVEIRGGKIYSIDNVSGHFKPGSGSLDAVKGVFDQLPQNVFHKDFLGYILFGN